jgi:hypothetical protein
MIHAIGIDPVLRAAEGQNVKRAIGIVCRGLNHDWYLLVWLLVIGYWSLAIGRPPSAYNYQPILV